MASVLGDWRSAEEMQHYMGFYAASIPASAAPDLCAAKQNKYTLWFLLLIFWGEGVK